MKHQNYSNYRKSGIDLLGEAPEHWKIIKLKYTGIIKYGLGQPPEELEDGLPIIRATNVKRGKISPKNLLFVDPKDIPYERDPVLKEGDIIVVRSGAYTADSAFIPKEYEGSITGYDMVYRATSVDAKFLSYVLLSKYVLNAQLLQHALRAAQPHLNKEELGSTTILCPPQEEQQSIADFLDKEVSRIDTLIAKKQQFIERLKEKRLALISIAVTKGLNGNEELKPSGILWVDQIPHQWKTGKLKWYSLIYSGGTPDKTIDEYWEEGTVPWINSGAVNQRLITTPSAFITQEAFLKSSTKWIPQNALVIALAGQGKTKGMVAQLAIKTTCNQSMAAIIPNNQLNPRYLMYWLEINYQNIRNLSGGDQRDGLNLSMIGSIECIIPPLKEQNAIVELIDRQDVKHEAIITKTDEAIQKLQEYKTALISAAVTGKIKVTDQA